MHPGPVAHYAAPQLVKYSPHGVKYDEPHPQYVKTDVDDAPPHYEFAYNVHDELSGDVKSHAEKRNGDSVVGSYTIIDPDGEYSANGTVSLGKANQFIVSDCSELGYKRIVEYTADAQHGFNAVVRREPINAAAVKNVYAAEPQHLIPAEPQTYIP